VQKSTAEPIALALRHTTHPNEHLSTFNTGLSYALAGLYSSGDGMLKGLSEANRIFDVTGEIKSVSCGIYYMNWFFALMNGMTTGASAFNGVKTFFSFIKHEVTTDVIGAYFGLIVLLSSANFNAKEGINLSDLPSFKTWEFLCKHYGLTAIPLITNTAFSAYQVSRLLMSLGLDSLEPSNWGLSAAMAILSTVSLSLTQIANQRKKLLLAEASKYPALSSFEDITLSSDTTKRNMRKAGVIRHAINLLGFILLMCSPILNPLNTPQGLISLIILGCGFSSGKSDHVDCPIVHTLAVEVVTLIAGILIALPSRYQLGLYRIPKARGLFNNMTASISEGCQSTNGQGGDRQTSPLLRRQGDSKSDSQGSGGYGSGSAVNQELDCQNPLQDWAAAKVVRVLVSPTHVRQSSGPWAELQQAAGSAPNGRHI
jgi:hypothetical protein